LWFVAAFVALLALIAAACGDDEEATPATPSDTAATDTDAAEPSDSEDPPEPETTEAPEAPEPDEPETTEAPEPETTEAPAEPEPQEPAEPSGEPVRIGILFSNSGPAGVFGPPTANIAELIEEDINAAGGINGRPVETYLADDATDPAVGRQAMEQLIDSDNVDVVIAGAKAGRR